MRQPLKKLIAERVDLRVDDAGNVIAEYPAAEVAKQILLRRKSRRARQVGSHLLLEEQIATQHGFGSAKEMFAQFAANRRHANA